MKELLYWIALDCRGISNKVASESIFMYICNYIYLPSMYFTTIMLIQ